jgi:hypothetical protein
LFDRVCFSFRSVVSLFFSLLRSHLVSVVTIRALVVHFTARPRQIDLSFVSLSLFDVISFSLAFFDVISSLSLLVRCDIASLSLSSM